MIDRLAIRSKLNLLLLLPLAAVVLVAVPFAAGQIENARSAAATAESARNARRLGALVWELQRERLVTAGYLASPTADSAEMVLQQQAVGEAAEAARAALGPDAPDELGEALVRLGSLRELRQAALGRGVSLDSVARTYHAVIEAIIDALRLAPQKTSDAQGTRHLVALDALLRANEESALSGMALIAAAVNPQTGQSLQANALAQAQMFTERFVQQADAHQAGLVVLVDQGEAARRVDAVAERLPALREKRSVESFVDDALIAADSQASLRRLVQDQVTREIADTAAGRAGTAKGAAWSVGLGTGVLFAIVIALTVAVSRSIADPLQRLTRAATTVADLANAELVRVTDVEGVDERPARLAAIDVPSGDEVGELAAAFNRVQATAALLLERQVVSRRNVSRMFANVAQRTNNLVGRQLAVVDELERNEQDTRLLAGLYQLDHLSTRLRRNAENLLVVAGARDGARISGPMSLSVALRSALAEIEEYQRIRLGALSHITIAGPVAADLMLVFAELLVNGTASSPPDSFVDVRATLAADGWCRVAIIDRGIGMPPQRLAEENLRLVERERLDIAPTTVLGLFVVGRLARRHGLTVELSPTQGGGITAIVALPPSVFTLGASPLPAEPSEPGLAPAVPRRPVTRPPILELPVAKVDRSFSWFSLTTGEQKAIAAGPSGPADAVACSAPHAIASEESPPDPLNRRVPGAQLPATNARPADSAPTTRPVQDAAAARAALDGYQSAIARAASPPPPEPAPSVGRSGLARRVAGAHLAPGLRDGPPRPLRRPDAPSRTRDPESERAAFDGYSAALARAVGQTRPEPRDQHQ